MRAGGESSKAIWLVCIGIGLLFLARGAFKPYFFPLFENLAALPYFQIALLLNVYELAQSVCAPLAGWFADRTSTRIALVTSIGCGLAGFAIIATKPGFALAAIAVFVAGLAFVLGKIALNTVLVLHSSPESLRRSVAKRATLLNLGSFAGNSIAYQMTARVGYTAHAILLGLLYLPLAIGLKAAPAPKRDGPIAPKSSGISHFKMLIHNRGFVADALRRFAVVLPYGCWGTIIPKYAIDQYGSTEPVWIIGLTSLCTTIVGAHFLAVYLSGHLYRRGFKWEWWSMASVLLYCSGLLLLIFARTPIMLPLAVVVFICGEVLMTPCFDETAKKHSSPEGMSTCMGLLHLVDGLGRMFGAAFALAVYGWTRSSAHRDHYWEVVSGSFLIACLLLHGLARFIGQRARKSDPPLGSIPVSEESSMTTVSALAAEQS
jgi:MFS family permease